MAKTITRHLRFKARCNILGEGKTEFIVVASVLDSNGMRVQGIKASFTSLFARSVSFNGIDYKIIEIKNNSEHEFMLKLVIDSSVPSGKYFTNYLLIPLDDNDNPVQRYTGKNTFPFAYNKEKSSFDYERNVKLIQKLVKVWRKKSFEENSVEYLDKLFNNPKALGIPGDFEKLFKAVTGIYNGLSPEARAFTDSKTGQIQSVEQHYETINSYYTYCIANFHTVRQNILHDLQVASHFSVSIEGENVKVQKAAFQDHQLGPQLKSKVEKDFVNFLDDMLTRMYIILAQAGRKAYHSTVPQAGSPDKAVRDGRISNQKHKL